MIYIIDHNDSFTYNVVHQFSLYDEVECDNFNTISESKLKKAYNQAKFILSYSNDITKCSQSCFRRASNVIKLHTERALAYVI